MTSINQIADGILIPVIRREFRDLCLWLSHVPRPSLLREATLFLSIDNSWNSSEKDEILSIIRLRGDWFRDVIFIDCQIPDHESVYLREDPQDGDNADSLRYGHKSGPNKQFFIGQKQVLTSKLINGSLLQIEVDAFPLKPLWLDALNQEISYCRPFVLAGSQYQGNSELLPDIKYHINGNAVYGQSNPSFQFFLALWEASLVELIMHGAARHLAYDVFLEWADYYRGNKSIALFRNQDFRKLLSIYRDQSITINSLLNVGGKAEASGSSGVRLDYITAKFPKAEIIHCRAVRTDWLRMLGIVN